MVRQNQMHQENIIFKELIMVTYGELAIAIIISLIVGANLGLMIMALISALKDKDDYDDEC